MRSLFGAGCSETGRPKQIVGGIQKYTIPCNWKFAADNAWDFYHGITSHVSAYLTAKWRSTERELDRRGRYTERHLVFPGEYGHVRGGPARVAARNPNLAEELPRLEKWRQKAEALEEMGPVGIQAGGLSGIFPNLWITPNQLWLRLPKGPTVTELWSFLLLDPDLGPSERRAAIIGAQHGFGPAGFWEQDDGENWGQSTRGMVGNVSQCFPLHYGMQVGRGQVVTEENETPYIESGISEHAQLWYYRSWSEWMSSPSWEHLKLSHSIPEGVI